jgi:hypothetical protein
VQIGGIQAQMELAAAGDGFPMSYLELSLLDDDA